MLLNASKSNVITFTLRKTISSDQIIINDSVVEEHQTTKLLGVTFDQHLHFSKHVETIIDKCRPAFHAITKLRKAGVKNDSLCTFYKSRIVPLLTYAAPAWYPNISLNDQEKLEKYQRLCLRIMLPNIDGSENRQNSCWP